MDGPSGGAQPHARISLPEAGAGLVLTKCPQRPPGGKPLPPASAAEEGAAVYRGALLQKDSSALSTD